MSDFKLTTPVAFIIFNRPENTERVFSAIAKAKPTKLLVVADGPRANKDGELEKVSQTREIINRVDWECDVLTNYADENLGCKNRVSSGIDWIFQNVEEAIILEDDCLPDPTFFQFCQEMLEKYKLDQRIGIISGDNFQVGYTRNDDSYYFSKYVHIWGWATWSDRWLSSYDKDLSMWPNVKDGGWLFDILGNEQEMKVWHDIFEKMYNNEIDTWDYQWVFANWIEGRVNIVPNVNLISNIGFGADATHTVRDSDLANMPVERMKFPIKHPLGVFRNLQADTRYFKTSMQQSLFKRFFRKVIG